MHDFENVDRHAGELFPPPSTPRRGEGGIRSYRASGRPGATWWSQRWLAALEAMGLGERLERGRAYARAGQVLELEIRFGAIEATVQGTRREPYRTSIRVAQLSQLEWLEIAHELAARASTAASLLAGDLPEDVEATVARAGHDLFPTLEDDLELSCTCTDWARPCKHVAAVSYLVAELFDQNPFLLFRVRGIERELLLALLTGAREEDGVGVDIPELPADARDAAAVEAATASFWAGSPIEGLPAVDLQPPPSDAPLVGLLGPLPMWRGIDDFEASVGRMVAGAARNTYVLDLASGAAPGGRIR